MSDDELVPPVPRRPRKATGPARPRYLDDADIDRVMSVMLALVSEVAAIRERLDTHEQLAAAALPAAPAKVEAYVPAAEVEVGREAWRDAYIRRLFRVFTEDIEAMGRGHQES